MKFVFAQQQSVAQQRAKHLLPTQTAQLDEFFVVDDQHIPNDIGIAEQIQADRAKLEIHDVAVFARQIQMKIRLLRLAHQHIDDAGPVARPWLGQSHKTSNA